MMYHNWQAWPSIDANALICNECGALIINVWLSAKGRMAADVHEEFHNGVRTAVTMTSVIG